MKYFNNIFFSSSKDFFFALDADKKIVELSENWQNIWQYPEQDYYSKPLTDFIHPDDRVKTDHILDELIEKKSQIEFSFGLFQQNNSCPKLICTLSIDINTSTIFGAARLVTINEEKKNFLESTLDKLPILISFLDEKLNYKYLSTPFKDYFKITDQDFLNKSISDLMNYQLHAMIRTYMELALEGQIQLAEVILPESDEGSSYKILNINLIPCKAESGYVSGMYFIIHDITELKTSATIAIEKEKKLNALFNSLTQGVVLQDSKGKIVEFNQSALNILKLSKEQLFGKSSFDPYWRVVNEDLTSLPAEEHPAVVTLRTGLPTVGKVMGVYTSATELSWMSVTAVPLFSNSGTAPAEVLITFEDLTKTKKLKQELKAKSYWKDAIINGTDYLIISAYPDGTIATFNKKAEQILGYKADEVINKCTLEVLHSPDEIREVTKKLSLELHREIKAGFETIVTKALLIGPDTNIWTYVTKQHFKISVKLRMTAIFDEFGGCIGYLGIGEQY